MTTQVIKVFSEVLRISPDTINDDTSPENTPKWDSLRAMELVMALEEEFNIKLSTKEIVSMRSLGIVRKVLARKGIVNV